MYFSLVNIVFCRHLVLCLSLKLHCYNFLTEGVIFKAYNRTKSFIKITLSKSVRLVRINRGWSGFGLSGNLRFSQKIWMCVPCMSF